MLINEPLVSWFSPDFVCGATGEEGVYDLFAQDMESGHGPEAFETTLAAVRSFDLSEKSFSSKVFRVIGGLPYRIMRVDDLAPLCSRLSQGESLRDRC